MGKQRITKRPTGGGQLAHWLKGHTLERWASFADKPAMVKCSCGQVWV